MLELVFSLVEPQLRPRGGNHDTWLSKILRAAAISLLLTLLFEAPTALREAPEPLIDAPM